MTTEQAAALQPPREQEADQVTGAGVGPVCVLDHQRRPDRGWRAPRRRARTPRRPRPGRGPRRVRRSGERWLSRSSAGCKVRQRARVDLGGDLSQHLREREVGHRGLAEVQAVPDEVVPALDRRGVQGLGHQAGLADPGVAGEQHHPGRRRRHRRGAGRRARRHARRCSRSCSGPSAHRSSSRTAGTALRHQRRSAPWASRAARTASASAFRLCISWNMYCSASASYIWLISCARSMT